jgi:hypothetical protein
MEIDKFQKAERIVNSIFVRETHVEDLKNLKLKILSGMDRNVQVSIDGKNYYFFEDSFIQLIDNDLKIHNDHIFTLNQEFNKL